MGIRKIHLVAACGTGMGTLACMLKQQGYDISGSDQNIYPPMSDFLCQNGIELTKGFNPENIPEDTDLVIIGNAVTRQNPEAVYVLEKKIPYLSMPQALNKFFAKDKKIILVTGTHGKTTTSSIMAYLLFEAGLDPSFMIGGILKNFDSSFHIGNGDYFVIEGDEYDTAFFDKGPKFLHYNPFITINTGIEFDHADIFDNLEHIKETFRKLLKKLEPDSHLIAVNNNRTLDDILDSAGCNVTKYGKKAPGWSYQNYKVKSGKAYFDIMPPGKESIKIETSLMGKHNLLNAIAVACAGEKIGISDTVLKSAMKKFSGIKRRQEIRGVRNGVTIMDDFAHHPSAVKETIAAVKPFFQNGRIIAVFEPGTNTSMRSIFQDIYPESFKNADMVCIKEPSGIAKIPENERMSAELLVKDIQSKGVNAVYFKKTDLIVDYMIKNAEKNDLVLIMSNKGFDNIHTKLLNSL